MAAPRSHPHRHARAHIARPFNSIRDGIVANGLIAGEIFLFKSDRRCDTVRYL